MKREEMDNPALKKWTLSPEQLAAIPEAAFDDNGNMKTGKQLASEATVRHISKEVYVKVYKMRKGTEDEGTFGLNIEEAEFILLADLLKEER